MEKTFEISSKKNLLEQESQLPCSRVVNFFRIRPYFVSLTDKRIVWTIKPNRSSKEFCFSSLLSATHFALKYKNNHTYNFWLRLWSPIYSSESVISNL